MIPTPRHTLRPQLSVQSLFYNLRILTLSTQFSVNPKTGEIEIEWVNPDGGRPPVQIALRDERLYYTGDLSSFREYLGYDDTVKLVVCSISSSCNPPDSHLMRLIGI
jgi:hypothetical protein